MQNQEHEWQHSQDEQHTGDEPATSQVPSTLLPDVLYRLGLSTENSELPIADLLLKLQSSTWEKRALALHTLGKLEHPIPINLLSSFLKDEDETVRSTTVHLLGMRGKQAPLHWLVEALHDTDWHVREAAVFALAKQGTRVPSEVLMTALHDHDSSVREAAQFVLQRDSATATPSSLHEMLWKETPMQPEKNNSAHLNGKENHTLAGTIPYEAAPPDSWNGSFTEYSNTTPHAHTINEHAQAYAAGQYTPPNDAVYQESPPDEHASVMAQRGEKITSYRVRSKPHKGWWAAIVVTAMLFLGLGRLSTMTFMPQFGFGGFNNPKDVQIGKDTISQKLDPALFAKNPLYQQIMLVDLSNAMHITPQEILDQVKQKDNIQTVATAHNVSPEQLQKIEINAFTSISQSATQAGMITQQEADQEMNQLDADTALCNSVTMNLLVPNTSVSAPPPRVTISNGN